MIFNNQFFKKYFINQEKFKNLKIDENQLLEIYEDYCLKFDLLDQAAGILAESLRKVDNVHSIKFRTKQPEHLIEKIIRKAFKDGELNITKNNYMSKIHDLIGVRILHLYKDEWESIHNYITKTWQLRDVAVANVRDGDHKRILKKYKELGCEINEHENGYRSVHYTIESEFNSVTVICEIQVRTIFEEGWSEIDHRIRYPYYGDSIILNEYLEMFNRLAGNADEMGTFVKTLSESIKETENRYKEGIEREIELREYEIKKQMEEIKKRDNEIERLKATISKLEVSEHEKEKLRNDLLRIQQQSSKIDEFSTSISLEKFRSTNALKSVIKSKVLSSINKLELAQIEENKKK